jgi:hypothetical protein
MLDRPHNRLSIEYHSTSQLSPRANNPRTHSKKQIDQIAAAIRRFGFTNPILIDDANGIVAGHGRVQAATVVGLDQVPTVRLSAMSEAEIRAYVIADNRLAENAGWDRELLGLELQYLTDLDVDFDVTLTGFELPEIDLLIGELSVAGDNDPADAAVEVSAGPPVTRPGDLWRIGTHRLICGDSTRSETYQALLGEQRAQLVFTDPPYNVPISGHVGGLGAVQHREFVMASGEMSAAEFTAFLQIVFGHLAAHSVDGSIHFQCMDWRHLQEMLAAGSAAYTDLKNLCVWAKNNGGMGSLYRSQHELVFVFKSGTAPHINNVELGKHGRYRTRCHDPPAARCMRLRRGSGRHWEALCGDRSNQGGSGPTPRGGRAWAGGLSLRVRPQGMVAELSQSLLLPLVREVLSWTSSRRVVNATSLFHVHTPSLLKD